MDFVDRISFILNTFNNFGYKIVFFNILSLFGISDVKFPMITAILLFGSVYFMVRLRGIAFTQLSAGVRLILAGAHADATEKKSKEKQESISPIKALFASVAGAVGLGNISGVAVAITVAGPGAIFWMILTPFITMPLRFAEVFLGHKYRKKNPDGSFSGGPVHYMKTGLQQIGLANVGKFLAGAYAVMLLLSSFGGGCSFQSNQAVQVITGNFEALESSAILLAFVFVSVVAAVVLGGIKRIAGFLSTVIPVLIGVYFVSSLLIIGLNYAKLPDAVSTIMHAAFNIHSLAGGMLGSFIMGFNRIVVANETGLGTAPTMHANSSNEDSVKEAIISMAAPVIDTLFVCVMSAAIVIVTGAYQQNFPGIMMVTKAFETVHPLFKYVVIIMVPMMAMNVAVAWAYYGTKSCEYLLGNTAAKIYRFVFLGALFCGGVVKDFDIIVRLTDIVNMSLAIPNVIAVILLAGIVTKAYTDYRLKK